MTLDTLKKAEAICKAAISGAWKLWDGWGPAKDGLHRARRIGPAGYGGLTESSGYGDIAGTAADLEFVALSREGWPAVIAYARRLRKIVALQIEHTRDSAMLSCTTDEVDMLLSAQQIAEEERGHAE